MAQEQQRVAVAPWSLGESAVPGRVWWSPQVARNSIGRSGMVGTLVCPIEGCENHPDPDQPVCSRHRSQLPERLRNPLVLLWREYLEDAIDARRLRAYERMLWQAQRVFRSRDGLEEA